MELIRMNRVIQIQVGQDVPYLKQGITDTSSAGSVNQTYEYKSTGVILKVTPYVTSTDLISLDIEQTMSQAVTNTITPNINSPVFNQRIIGTSMTIANGQTMVLGGLIQERVNDALDSLPIINKIPFLKGVFEPWAEVTYLPGKAIGPDAVKIGMLSSVELVRTVAAALKELGL